MFQQRFIVKKNGFVITMKCFMRAPAMKHSAGHIIVATVAIAMIATDSRLVQAIGDALAARPGLHPPATMRRMQASSGNPLT